VDLHLPEGDEDGSLVLAEEELPPHPGLDPGMEADHELRGRADMVDRTVRLENGFAETRGWMPPARPRLAAPRAHASRAVSAVERPPGEMSLRWTAAGMLEAERQLRKVVGYRDRVGRRPSGRGAGGA